MISSGVREVLSRRTWSQEERVLVRAFPDLKRMVHLVNAELMKEGFLRMQGSAFVLNDS